MKFRISCRIAAVLTAALVAGGLQVSTGFTATRAKARTTTGARSAARSAAGPTVPARVGNTTITRADFDARLADVPPQYRAQFSTPEGKRQFLGRLIEERVWLESALRAGVERRVEVKKQLEDYRRQILITTLLREITAGAPAPADSTVQAYYEVHKSEYMTEEEVRVSQIQTKTEKAARELKRRLDKGADFAALAKEASTDSVTRASGGDLGYASRGGFVGSLGRQPALAETVFAAPIGAVRGPLSTGLGWHLLKVTERKPAAPRPIEDVRPAIVRQLTQSGNMAFYQEQLERAKERLGVTVDSAAVKALASAQKSAGELFREAAEIPSPDERIEAYRHILDLYPTSEFAPQAQFMMGFVESEEKRDYDKAEEAFKGLIAKYPRSELVPSAQWMIENMRSDKTPDFDLPGGMGKASEHDASHRTPADATRP